MNKKLTALSTTIVIGLGTVFAVPNVKAQANVQAGISQANVEISQYQQQLNKLNEQVARVDKAIADNSKMITDTENKIKESNAQIEQLQQQVATINDRIEKRNVILKKRAQAIQETGGNVSYIDVLLGASSFSDFIDRVGAVTTMVQADQDLMQQAETDKQEVQKKQDSVEKKLENLNNMKTDLEGMKADILEQKTQNDALKAALQSKQQASMAEKAALVQQLAQEQQPVPASPAAPAENQTASVSKPSAGTINITISTPKTSGTVNDIISAGYKYIGNSVYVFGGGRSAYDVAHGRFDCSGFVHWAFAQGGYNIGSSTDSLKNTGTRVSTSDMQPGDLVFFNTYKTDGHVGIYMGGGKFIGSQSSTGVAIADLTSGYWAAHFNGRVVRIVNN
jgi:peptidoglycan hydrolase CwlO-like protein